jgi:ribosomal protein S18 acetylase RimI-like enzyme
MTQAEAAPAIPSGWARAAGAGLTFQTVSEADLPFLARLYASTRTEELAVTDWSDAHKAAFLDMQFQAQHAHYEQYYAKADRLVIRREATPIGRLYLARWAQEHRIVDVALLPEHRGQGLGTALLRDLRDEAAAAGKPVSIHVETFNPAYGLYRRLGFEKIGDYGAYDLMRWSPPQFDIVSTV